jgi:RecA-family ATPase
MPRDDIAPLPLDLAGKPREQDPPDEKWSPIKVSSLSLRRPAPRVFIIPEWVPKKATTAVYAEGGRGKTLLSLLLQASCAGRIPWGGLASEQCRSVGLYCEDDDDELHRRMIDICEHFERTPNDFEGMTTISGFGRNNVLVEPDTQGRMKSTPKFQMLEKLISAERAGLVTLDTAADVFAGDENNRQQVRQFIGFLNGLAYDHDCAVLLNAHPSRTGIRTGDIDGGNTAWNNSVRCRLSLEVASGADADPRERILTKRKANYSTTGDTIRLAYSNGVLVPVEQPSGIAAASLEAKADAVFLTLLAARTSQDRSVSHKAASGNYAPKQFAKCEGRQSLTAKDLERAMERLFAAGKIKVEMYGKAGGGREKPERIVAVD